MFLHTIMSILAYSVAALNPFQRKSKRPFISGKLGNTPFSALFDTGADISCINEQLFRKLHVTNRPKQLPPDKAHQFKSAGGQTLEVKGKYRLPIQLAGKQVEHDFYVIKNLNKPVILGIDFITDKKLQYCPQAQEFYWLGEQQWRQGTIKTTSTITLTPLSVTNIKVCLVTDTSCRPTQEVPCMMEIQAPDFPLVSGGPALIKIDNQGIACVQIQNCAPFNVEIPRNSVIGKVENLTNCSIDQLNPQYLNSIAAQLQTQAKVSPCSE